MVSPAQVLHGPRPQQHIWRHTSVRLGGLHDALERGIAAQVDHVAAKSGKGLEIDVDDRVARRSK